MADFGTVGGSEIWRRIRDDLGGGMATGLPARLERGVDTALTAIAPTTAVSRQELAKRLGGLWEPLPGEEEDYYKGPGQDIGAAARLRGIMGEQVQPRYQPEYAYDQPAEPVEGTPDQQRQATLSKLAGLGTLGQANLERPEYDSVSTPELAASPDPAAGGFASIKFAGDPELAYTGTPNPREAEMLATASRLGQFVQRYEADPNDQFKMRRASTPSVSQDASPMSAALATQLGQERHINGAKAIKKKAVESAMLEAETDRAAQGFEPMGGDLKEMVYRYVKPKGNDPSAQKEISEVFSRIDRRMADRFSGIKPGAYSQDDIREAGLYETLDVLSELGHLTPYEQSQILSQQSSNRIGPTGDDNAGDPATFAQLGYKRSEWNRLTPEQQQKAIDGAQSRAQKTEQAQLEEQGRNNRLIATEVGKNQRAKASSADADRRAKARQEFETSEREASQQFSASQQSERLEDSMVRHGDNLQLALAKMQAESEKAKNIGEQRKIENAINFAKLFAQNQGFNVEGLSAEQIIQAAKQLEAALGGSDGGGSRAEQDFIDAVP